MKDLFDEIRRMQDEMDRMFDGFFRGNSMPALEGPKGKSVPAKPVSRAPVSNIYETEGSVIASFEIPGAEKENINLNVTEASIEVSAKKKLEKEVKEAERGYYSYSSASSQFFRRLPLPARIVPDKSVAVYKDGVLRVTMPKASPSSGSKGHRLQIR